MSSTSEKANLARIRDNQRRSRARRKEYLQELEARLRQCELQGIEASSEIQLAARQVAEENKKLRILLAQNGVTDDTIEAYLNTSSSLAGDGLMSSSYHTGGSAAVQLLGSLQTRKPICCTGNPQSTQLPSGSRDSSASATTVQSLWDPLYARPGLALQAGQTVYPAHQFMTPSTSIASQTSSMSHGHTSHQEALPSVQMPRSPSSNPPNHSQHQHLFDLDPQISASSSYISQQNSINNHLRPHPGAQRSSIYARSTNVNNCNYATDMITAMNGGEADPTSVRAELGCLPGIECDVDNHRLFEVMDRYSDVGNITML